jgi:hypothetical protein
LAGASEAQRAVQERRRRVLRPAKTRVARTTRDSIRTCRTTPGSKAATRCSAHTDTATPSTSTRLHESARGLSEIGPVSRCADRRCSTITNARPDRTRRAAGALDSVRRAIEADLLDPIFLQNLDRIPAARAPRRRGRRLPRRPSDLTDFPPGTTWASSASRDG